ncbi:hypothetical protein HPB48_014909 [Haemaphysalis longicornis]|uniref:Uncharacterized protein n=1 Tax=Haemaphysalis longicornis TaxID=44386 RepID=A0A9J6GSU0_HAELO|nr:hypothetical protein HPB48_014909 [Haemaphysalis longicornis]
MDAANALVALHATPGEVAGLESFARNTLVHLVQIRVEQGVQVDSGSAPSKQTTLMDFLKNDSDVKAFTGVESRQLLEGVAEAVSETDLLKTERSVLERVVLLSG